MKLTTSVALLGSLAAALPSDLALRAPTLLNAKLEMDGNSLVKATLTNTGTENLRLFITGSILDSIPVQKVQVFSDGEPLEFYGIYARVDPKHADEGSFKDLAPGSSLENSFDIAELYDLSQGGKFTVHSEGIISYAAAGGKTVVGSVGFSSNALDIDVDGAEASKVQASSVLHQKPSINKRTVVQGDCSGENRRLVLQALLMCMVYSDTAYKFTFDSVTPDAKMIEYFKTATAEAKLYVASGFYKVLNVCSGFNTGDTRLYCSDAYNSCGPGIFAYAVPRDSNMVLCPVYFDYPVEQVGACHDSDSGTTLLHEVTHLSQTLGTSDYNTYRYDDLRKLTSEQNLNHADTYTYYAQSLLAKNC